jgi:LysR family hydrogen peroxide-inducible transcriptional activator
MELDQLRHFVRVAELNSFTRAALAVRLSQPALSRSIARLEEELGQPLLERRSRGVSLTHSGHLLLGRARQILTLVEDARTEISDDGETGRIRIAAIPTVAPYFLPEQLRQFQRQCPRAQMIIQEDTTDRLLKRVADGEIDIAIAALPITMKYLLIEPLFEEELLLVMAPEHPLNRRKAIRVSDVESLPFVLLGEAHCLTENVLSFCRQKSFSPVAVERTSQLAMVQELVSLNHGISLIPAMARALDTSDRRVYRSLSDGNPTRTIAMVTNPYRYQSKLQQKFQEMLRPAAKSSGLRLRGRGELAEVKDQRGGQ